METGQIYLEDAMANLGCQYDTPGKKEPQLKNCPHQTGLETCLWDTLIAN